MKKTRKQMNEGITLIALVITIIVLLILVGVTIATLTGENGILSKTTEASENTEEKNAEEEVKIAIIGSIGINGELENEELKYNLNQIEKISGVPEVITDSSYPIKVTIDGKYSYLINKDGNIGEVVEREGIQIGDYVNYTYNEKAEGYSLPTKYSGYKSDQTINQKIGMKWRILNIHIDGTVDLIGDINSSDQKICFQGELGYNNGVYLLNDMCKELYSNSTFGVTARNIKLEDIENQMNEAGIAARKAYTYDGMRYGDVKTYTGGATQYPNLYAQEKGSGIDTGEANINGIGASDNGYTSPTTETSSKATSLTVTQTFYLFSNTPANYFKDCNGNTSVIRDILFNTGISYWLATRAVQHWSNNYAIFGLNYIVSYNMTRNTMCYSMTGTSYHSSCLRPVVSLGPDIKIEACEGVNASNNMHEISK